MHGSRPRKRGWRRAAWRAVRKVARRAAMSVALYTVPYVYVAYMWLVYRTSRVEELGYRPDLVREEAGRGIYAIWHDEVFFVAWSFGKYRPDTLASAGDAGEIITRMLQLCGFRVFRGGSTSGRRRRSARAVVEAMVEHMREAPGVLYGITTDGSKGPVYRMKPGVVMLAASAEAPIFVEKTWCRRYWQLPTWDRTLVPLPFNHIVHVYAGPIHPPPDVSDPERFEATRREVEGLLCRVSAYARRRAEGRPPPEDWIALFPAEHRDAMARAEEPLLRSPLRAVEVDPRPASAAEMGTNA